MIIHTNHIWFWNMAGNLFLVKYMITVLIFVVLNVIYSTLYETSLLTFFQLHPPASSNISRRFLWACTLFSPNEKRVSWVE